jgi:hypothetical protein
MNNEFTSQETASAPGHYNQISWFLCEPYG